MTKFGHQVATCLIIIECVIKSTNMFPVSTKNPAFLQENVTENYNGKPDIDTTPMGGVNDVTQFDTTVMEGVNDVMHSGEFAVSQDVKNQNKYYINVNSSHNLHSTFQTRGNLVKKQTNMELQTSGPTIVSPRTRANSTSSIDILISSSNIMEEAGQTSYRRNVSMGDIFVFFTEKPPHPSASQIGGSHDKPGLLQGAGSVTISSISTAVANIDKTIVNDCIRQASNLFMQTTDVFTYIKKKYGVRLTMRDALLASDYDETKLNQVIEELKTHRNISIVKAVQAVYDTLLSQDDTVNYLYGDDESGKQETRRLNDVRNKYRSLRSNVRKLLPHKKRVPPGTRRTSDVAEKLGALAVLNKVSEQTRTILEEISRRLKD